jgi:hypothetical protein
MRPEPTPDELLQEALAQGCAAKSAASKKLWKDPVFRAKQMAARERNRDTIKRSLAERARKRLAGAQ